VDIGRFLFIAVMTFPTGC